MPTAPARAIAAAHAGVKLSDVLLDLFHLSTIVQSTQLFNCGSTIAPVAYLRQFCTIKLCAPRGAGHTHAAAALLRRAGAPNCLVLSTSRDHSAKVWEQAHLPFPKDHDGVSCTWHDLQEKQVIIIDIVSTFSRGRLEKIYEHAAQHLTSQGRHPFYIVQLG